MSESAVRSVEIWMTLAGVVCILLPVAAAIGWHRRTGAVYRAFAFGALVFFIAQIVLRFPWQLPLNAWVQRHEAWQLPFLAFSALTAGLFEEVGRYAGYRWLLRERQTPQTGVMYGLGHGGIEAILLAGVQLIATVVVLHLWSIGMVKTPAADTAMQQLVGTYTPSTALAAVVERAIALALHVGLALVVLQSVVRRQLRWLAYAIVIHCAIDFVAAWLHAQAHAPVWVLEGVLVVLSLPVLYFGARVSGLSSPASRRSSIPPA